MAVAGKTRNFLEGLVREGSFKWLLGTRTYFDEEFEEIRDSPSAGRNWIMELSPVANIVVRTCSKTLGISLSELQEGFNQEASDSIKQPSRFARNFLEYCCFRALALSTQVPGHLSDKKFRRLSYDMMIAWETPDAGSQPLLNVDEDISVGLEAFCRIAPAVPIIANVITSENIFDVLSASTGGRLKFSIYDKYLSGLERVIRKMRSNSDSSLLSALRSSRDERILEVDGTVTTQPVLEHVGLSAWPGRLILTDHALYFEALLVVKYDKPKKYDLADDLKQVIKPEMTGPLGTRIYDKAVFYNSESLSEPVVMEFPEFKGGDLILESLANMSNSRNLDCTDDSKAGSAMNSSSALDMVPKLRFVFGTSTNTYDESRLVVGEMCVGEMSSLEREVKESKNNYKKVESAKATVDGVKVDGIDTKLAVLKELLFPINEFGKFLKSLAYWDDPWKSLGFCLVFIYIICRGWLGYVAALMLLFLSAFMIITRYFSQGRPVEAVKVVAPDPTKNTIEHILAVQNAVTHGEQFMRDVNIFLLKLRGLSLSIFPQATKKFAFALIATALVLAVLPGKCIVLMVFLEIFTRYSPPRKATTERWSRRLREWWFSIPAAPFVLQRDKDDKKRK
ncbi:hypothetical protein K1719_015172 [Acacia pycnantha]|nr:hypothetical protein K1719_015172 [Acacia pycnantha]